MCLFSAREGLSGGGVSRGSRCFRPSLEFGVWQQQQGRVKPGGCSCCCSCGAVLMPSEINAACLPVGSGAERISPVGGLCGGCSGKTTSPAVLPRFKISLSL